MGRNQQGSFADGPGTLVPVANRLLISQVVPRERGWTQQPVERMASQEQTSGAMQVQLVAAMAEGDEHALGQLYDLHGPLAYGLAYRMLGNPADAEEVVADAFAYVWRTASTFDRSRGSVRSWIVTVVRSRALDRLRSAKRAAHALRRATTLNDGELVVPIAPDRAPDRAAEEGETRQLVAQSLAGLPEAQRRVIELAYFQGLSQSEIASRLNEPLGTVKTRMRAGLTKLREVLRPIFVEEVS